MGGSTPPRLITPGIAVWLREFVSFGAPEHLPPLLKSPPRSGTSPFALIVAGLVAAMARRTLGDDLASDLLGPPKGRSLPAVALPWILGRGGLPYPCYDAALSYLENLNPDNDSGLPIQAWKATIRRVIGVPSSIPGHTPPRGIALYTPLDPVRHGSVSLRTLARDYHTTGMFSAKGEHTRCEWYGFADPRHAASFHYFARRTLRPGAEIHPMDSTGETQDLLMVPPYSTTPPNEPLVIRFSILWAARLTSRMRTGTLWPAEHIAEEMGGKLVQVSSAMEGTDVLVTYRFEGIDGRHWFTETLRLLTHGSACVTVPQNGHTRPYWWVPPSPGPPSFE